MNAKDIRKGIAAYEHERAVLLRVIRRHGGSLPHYTFDRIFGDFRPETSAGGATVMRRRRIKIRFIPKETSFILGSLSQGEWSKWLDLLQHMVRAGDVKTSTIGGVHYYRAAR